MTNVESGVPEKKAATGSKTRILVALADKENRLRLKSMFAPDIYTLSWAADARIVRSLMDKKRIDAIILDVSSWSKDKCTSSRNILKSAVDVPVVILPEGLDGTATALKTFGVSYRTVPWEILDRDTLQAMTELVIKSRLDRQSLHESEQQFAKTFHSSPGMFAISTPKDGRHVDVNDTWLTIMGYQRDEVIGRTARELGVWDNTGDRARLVDELLKHGKVRGFETRYRTKTKTTIDVLVAGELIDIHEEPHLLLVALDITERRKTEEALKKSHDELELNIYERTLQLREEVEERRKIQKALEISEQRAQDMAEAASDWFWETDAKGKFTYFSESHEKVLGVDSSALIGKKRRTLAVGGEDKEKWREHAKIIATRQPFRDFQYEHVRAGKQPQFVKVSGKPVFDGNGKFVGYRGAGANISVQVLAERREAKTREQLVDAIESISDALILFDADEKFVMCNSRHRQIFKMVDHIFVPGMPFRNILDAFVEMDVFVGIRDNPQKWIRERLAERKNPGQNTSRREARLHDGTWLRFNEYKTSEGGVLLLLTDITVLRQSEKELLRAKNQAEIANRAKSDFLAGMSHELRTPLNAIIGFSDVMISEIYGQIKQEKYREYIADINQSGVHLLKLINDILDISKIESGTVTLNESVLNIRKSVETSIRLIENAAQQGKLTLKVKVPKKVPSLLADERRVNQILLNLVSNAVKFTPAGGTVTIGASVNPSGALVLSISDTGIGISSDQIENVMSEFGQVDNIVARDKEGTGLGLPLTRGLMQVHGGLLEMESTPGKGTIVKAIFPKERVVR